MKPLTIRPLPISPEKAKSKYTKVGRPWHPEEPVKKINRVRGVYDNESREEVINRIMNTRL